MTKVIESAEYDNFLGKKEEVLKPAALFEIEEDDGSEREKLWVGMPEFEQKDNPPFKTIYVHFRNKEDFDTFVSKYKNLDEEQNITPKTKSMWYPHLDKDENSLKRWFEE
jgi:hypothetical protein